MDEVVDAWVSDTAYTGQRGLWVDLPPWRRMVGENRPQALLAADVQRVALRLAG